MDPKSAGLIPKNMQNIQWVKGLLVCLIFVLGFTACVTPLVEPSQTVPPLISPSLTATGTFLPPATDTPPSPPTELPSPTYTLIPRTPTNTSVPLYALTPLITPSEPQIELRFDSWSPDGQWIAYWTGEGYGEGDEVLPASLAFFEVVSGESCLHEEVIGQNLWDGRVRWQEDGSTIIIPNPPSTDTLTGSPCGKFLPFESLPQAAPGELSPDSRYLASTESGIQGPGLIPFTTTVTAAETGQVIARVVWEFGRGYASGGGPGWLSNEVYLIGPDVNQGFLYLSVVDKEVKVVVTELLGLEPIYIEQYRSIFSQVNPATGNYHLLLKWEGGPTPLPLLLYHSELGEVEELPFYSAWPFASSGLPSGFSPDGAWLLVGDPLEENYPDQVGGDYWIRPVDPSGSEAIRIAKGMHPGGLSLETQKMAFSNGQALNILSLSTGEVLSRWSAPNYEFVVHSFVWSPDGSHLAFLGLNTESSQTALFVIEP